MKADITQATGAERLESCELMWILLRDKRKMRGVWIEVRVSAFGGP